MYKLCHCSSVLGQNEKECPLKANQTGNYKVHLVGANDALSTGAGGLVLQNTASLPTEARKNACCCWE